MNTSKISIFIVDDHPLMRQALTVSIQTEEDMEIVGMAVDGAEAIEMIPAVQPNVVIMDLMMPNVDGITAILNLSQTYPEARILVLSSLDKEETIFKTVQAGALGYVTKDVQHNELIDAIRVVSMGKSYLPEKIMKKLMGGVRQSLVKEKSVNPIDVLTKREIETLTLMGKGYSNSKIAECMFIAEATVRVHTHQIMKKMNFENRREAAVFASQQELKK